MSEREERAVQLSFEVICIPSILIEMLPLVRTKVTSVCVDNSVTRRRVRSDESTTLTPLT